MITYKVTKNFFDRKAVIEAVGRAKAASLSKAGAFVRTAARSRLRPGGKKNRVSAPGESPRTHTSRTPNLKTILFAWDARSQSVVIGPVGFNALSVSGGSLSPGVVPGVLEFGGTLGVLEAQDRDGAWSRADLRSRRRFAGRPTRVRQATYAPRPFMGPAMRQELPKFPDLWKNSVVRSS
jgi:hypothetical protein